MSLMPFVPLQRSLWNPFSMISTPADSLMNTLLSDSLGQIQQLERQLGELEPTIDDKTGNFSFRCNVAGYRPEELQVDIQGDCLTVHGEHQFRDKRQTVHRTFKRTVLLPENVLRDTIQCNIDERGRLEVRAQGKAIEGGQQPRKSIPVNFRHSMDQPAQIQAAEQQKQVDAQQKK